MSCDWIRRREIVAQHRIHTYLCTGLIVYDHIEWRWSVTQRHLSGRLKVDKTSLRVCKVTPLEIRNIAGSKIQMSVNSGRGSTRNGGKRTPHTPRRILFVLPRYSASIRSMKIPRQILTSRTKLIRVGIDIESKQTERLVPTIYEHALVMPLWLRVWTLRRVFDNCCTSGEKSWLHSLKIHEGIDSIPVRHASCSGSVFLKPLLRKMSTLSSVDWVETYLLQKPSRILRISLLRFVVNICHSEACRISISPLEVVEETCHEAR